MAKRRKPTTQSVLNWGTVVNVATIPILSALLALVGFYFKMGDIPARLDKEAAMREQQLEKEGSAREQLRSALLNYADKTQHSIDSLAAHGMVQDEQIKSVNSSLDKVVNGLQNLELAVGRPPATKR